MPKPAYQDGKSILSGFLARSVTDLVQVENPGPPGGFKLFCNQTEKNEKETDMGRYVARAISAAESKDIITTIRDGYGIHRPNPQIACILVLESNLGCRIGDIINLHTDSFVDDGGIWKINIVEQKTGKKRIFIVAKPVMDFINKWISDNSIAPGERLFNIKAPAVWKALRQVRDYLDMEDVSTHSFRRSAANRIYKNTGHDIEATRQFLQHSDTKITSMYIRRSSEQMEKAILASAEIV